MKSFQISFLLLFFATTSLFSQIDTFDISRYALPKSEVKSLDLNASLGGSSQSISSNLNLGVQSSFTSDLALLYYSFKSTPTLQKETSGSLSNYLLYQNSAVVGGLVSSNVIENNTVFRTKNSKRNYFQPTRFYSINYDISAVNSMNSATNDGGIQSIKNDLNTNVSLPILYGFGRIEPVTGAWKAVRILKGFEDLKLLTRTPTEYEITEFSQLLSDLHYSRIYDTRKVRIQNIQDLDAHLAKTGLIKAQNALYFTSLYDMYQFGTQAVRLSGERISFGIAPSAKFYATYFNDQQNVTSLQYSIAALGRYDFHNPIDQQWQLDINAALRTGYEYRHEVDYGIFIRPDFTIKTAYYPSSRTTFSAEFKLAADFYNNLSTIILVSEGKRTFGHLSSISINVDYYMSAKTRLSATLKYQYSQNYKGTSLFSPFVSFVNDGFNLNYQLAIKHAIY